MFPVSAPLYTYADGLKPRTCLRCGFPGPHDSPAACISGLRDRIAALEFARRTQPAGERPRRERKRKPYGPRLPVPDPLRA
jgi:hypothetical protein